MVNIGREYAGQRLDNFLLRELKGVPKSLVYKIIRRGEVRVNKGRSNARYRLNAGDTVRIPPVRQPDPAQAAAPPRGLLQQLNDAILFEDQRLLVINKPSGMAVHGGSGVRFGVIENLRALRPQLSELELVHRLDRETSGCLLLAKKRSTLRMLHELIRAGEVEKKYLALVAGQWGRSETLTIDAPLKKNTLHGGERVVRVDADGKPSVTHFTVLKRFSGYTLVEALLETGRTHQIRVHLAHHGTPILGDPKYGDETANRSARSLGLHRLFLHAASLVFTHPESGRLFRFAAQLDDELQQLIETLQR